MMFIQPPLCSWDYITRSDLPKFLLCVDEDIGHPFQFQNSWLSGCQRNRFGKLPARLARRRRIGGRSRQQILRVRISRLRHRLRLSFGGMGRCFIQSLSLRRGLRHLRRSVSRRRGCPVSHWISNWNVLKSFPPGLRLWSLRGAPSITLHRSCRQAAIHDQTNAQEAG